MNQYGRADHDQLTRDPANAVARRARGLIVIAEEHRDEFQAVESYLNELAELDLERGIAVWLVEAQALRIEDSPWAPLFSAVVEPNVLRATVEQARQSASSPASLDEFWEQFDAQESLGAAQDVVNQWMSKGHHRRLGPNHVVLQAAGRSTNGYRTVVAVYSDGRILVPFSSYAGQNSGIPIEPLTTPVFRSAADSLFGFGGSERQARTAPGSLAPERADSLLESCVKVADAY